MGMEQEEEMVIVIMMMIIMMMIHLVTQTEPSRLEQMVNIFITRGEGGGCYYYEQLLNA